MNFFFIYSIIHLKKNLNLKKSNHYKLKMGKIRLLVWFIFVITSLFKEQNVLADSITGKFKLFFLVMQEIFCCLISLF